MYRWRFPKTSEATWRWRQKPASQRGSTGPVLLFVPNSTATCNFYQTKIYNNDFYSQNSHVWYWIDLRSDTLARPRAEMLLLLDPGTLDSHPGIVCEDLLMLALGWSDLELANTLPTNDEPPELLSPPLGCPISETPPVSTLPCREPRGVEALEDEPSWRWSTSRWRLLGWWPDCWESLRCLNRRKKDTSTLKGGVV